ncbi:helix-turn-helix domain-containing protein [Mesorhizobium sp. AR07]|uniref:helix-turn-helix domain-containing protein n=1 Tax=Mesorhizobium sp. AR07 TaxID=2865838 RepID=UPI00215F7549|nr:helix-turn-helix domain-containing protein [Mesorhizobium sp. AR07]UVK45676.1 helix-turn-helix domain-containing protein [Mesorhizobium sp. AR07]
MRLSREGDPPEYLTVAEAAAISQRTASWIRNWISCGQLSASRMGPRNRLHVLRSDVEFLINQRRPKLKSPIPYLRLVVDNT